MTLTTPRPHAGATLHDHTAPTRRHGASDSRTLGTSTLHEALPSACGPVSAAIRVTLSVSPDRPRVIVSLVGQLDRAVIASDDVLADHDLMLAARMLEGLYDLVWTDVDPRWVEDSELLEARDTLESALREARDRQGR